MAKRPCYLNWPKDSNGQFLRKLPDEYMDLKDFVSFLRDIKERRSFLFMWWPGKMDIRKDMTNQEQPMPELVHMWHSQPRLALSPYRQYPQNTLSINLSSGAFAKDWKELQNLFEATELRYTHNTFTKEEHIKKGKWVKGKVKSLARKLLKQEYTYGRTMPGCRFDGVCSFRAFNQEFQWSY